MSQISCIDCTVVFSASHHSARRCESCRKQQSRVYNKRWRDKQPKGYSTARVKSWETAKGTSSTSRHYKKRYGLTYEDVVNLYESQKYLCAICSKDVTLGGSRETTGVIDHDHDTGRVRGVLCIPCNLMIGYSKDSVAILEKAMAYLKGE